MLLSIAVICMFLCCFLLSLHGDKNSCFFFFLSYSFCQTGNQVKKKISCIRSSKIGSSIIIKKSVADTCALLHSSPSHTWCQPVVYLSGTTRTPLHARPQRKEDKWLQQNLAAAQICTALNSTAKTNRRANEVPNEGTLTYCHWS